MNLSQNSLCVLENIFLAMFLFVLYVSKFSSLAFCNYFGQAVRLISIAFLISSFKFSRHFFLPYFFFVPIASLAAFL